MIKIGAGWNKYSENGAYISWGFDKSLEGTLFDLTKINLMCFENKEKLTDESPDWHLCIAERKKQ
jgi:uncharacterized protein (DUF736 family)